MKMYTSAAVARRLDMTERNVRLLRDKGVLTEYKPGLYEELELQVRKNELHTTEDIEKALTDMLVNFRTKLMAIPAKLSPVMAKKKDQTEIFKLMKAAIDETLEELADFDRICREDRENEG